MKTAGLKSLIVVALTSALILLNHPAFAQAPAPSRGASGDSVPGEASTVSVSTRDSVQPARPKAIDLAAVTPISFLPADIFDLSRERERIETPNLVASIGPMTVKKSVAGENGDEPAALAKKLLNPVSSLARISFETNLDFLMAADREGYRIRVNLEPVIPFKLNKDWNLISRTSVPVIQQDDIVATTMQTGLGDILQSFFISPGNAKSVFWGAGATLQIPTATDTQLGSGKLGLGPALVVGKQHSAWTYGVLARHIWSVAGHSDRPDVRSAFIEPFVAYITRSAWTYSLDTESTYDWVGKQWSIPIHFEVTKVVGFGRQPVSVGAALTCWAATAPGGPQACGVRFMVTPLFPAR